MRRARSAAHGDARARLTHSAERSRDSRKPPSPGRTTTDAEGTHEKNDAQRCALRRWSSSGSRWRHKRPRRHHSRFARCRRAPRRSAGARCSCRSPLPRNVAADRVAVTLNGRDVRAAFRPGIQPQTLAGLVAGLNVGSNQIQASAPGERRAQITIVNHPITGPVIAGPHQTPFVCETEAFGLGPATRQQLQREHARRLLLSRPRSRFTAARIARSQQRCRARCRGCRRASSRAEVVAAAPRPIRSSHSIRTRRVRPISRRPRRPTAVRFPTSSDARWAPSIARYT